LLKTGKFYVFAELKQDAIFFAGLWCLKPFSTIFLLDDGVITEEIVFPLDSVKD
jgi:hypothetical protein